MSNTDVIMPGSLDAAGITALLAEKRLRGVYEPVVRNFAESGDMAMDVRSNAQLKDKPTDALYQSFNLNVKKYMKDNSDANLTVVKTPNDETVVLVNLTVHAAAIAEDAK